ncbi:Methionine gamma-lyase [Hondaea fermentalgiana]|uniref:Methionine gamma-lyase n=1 Tax=Hondaea fermentalgiana TaxID=2315210 RepID=A0A2R5GA35_9STRA|nr:Methionine gamma-lyase [Hondaea fermentalgiana]|eukprot:GBG24961.1 Methionine gamma-lyase [Hondaea fermentalgiana]
MKYLQKKGYEVIPVNPGMAGKEILGAKCYASLAEVPGPIDMVDIFRSSDAALEVTKDAIQRKDEKNIRVVWMQLGVRNEEARELCEANGVQVVMDRCPKIEFSRLFGELGWHGFNSGVISSKRRQVGRAPGAGSSQSAPTFSGLETRCVHSGTPPDANTGARAFPIYQTSGYVFEDVDDAASLFNLQSFGNIYGRLSNPTVAALEERICTLEGGRGATCTASGHAAQLVALFTLMGPGDHFVASKNLYGGSFNQFKKMQEKFGWTCTHVDVDDPSAVREALSHPRCKLLWVESLANPGGVISDIEMLSGLTKEAGVPLAVDNTMATPALCQPGAFGADLVVHSTTKFLSGNGTSLGGCVVDMGSFDWSSVPADKFPSLTQPEPGYHGLTFWESFGDLAFTTHAHTVGLRDLGPTMAPMNAFLTLLGTETLALRMDRHVENASKVATFLEAQPEVAWVSYAGLESSSYYTRAQKYLPRGAGSVFTFGLKGGYKAGVDFVENLHLVSHVANLGDSRSLALHPASTTHRQLSDEQRTAAGAGDDVIRLSIGLETAEDIISDMKHAFSKIVQV